MAPAGSHSLSTQDVHTFGEYLKASTRIIALLGAGLSASSGLPTFRGAGGLWRSHDAMALATPEAFKADPGLVWQFYSYRRHMALSVKPNRAHYALAELARRKDGFMCLSQNVDGLSPRADHPADKLLLLHGSLFDARCTNFYCDFREQNNFTDPIVPALAIPTDQSDPTTTDALHRKQKDVDISDPNTPLSTIPIHELPRCPKCKNSLLRPSVVWFGEALPSAVTKTVDSLLDVDESPGVDLIIVIGTSSTVYPAAGYVDRARDVGARVAVVNMDADDTPVGGLEDGDWFFQGDAAVIVPEILKGVVGDINLPAGDV